MVEHIGRLAPQRSVVLRDRGDDRLGRLLTEFLRAMRDALLEQRSRIGKIRARAGAVRDDLGEVVETEHEAG